jgi:ABC-2 type transport system permease protein
MTGLIRAELIKARATRSFWALGILGVAFCQVWLAMDVYVFIEPGGSVVDAYGMAQQGYLFAMALGIQMTAGEYRHRTMTWAYLVTPRRGYVVTAKLAAAGLLGVLIGLAAAVVTAPVAAVLLSTTGHPAFESGVPGVLLASVLSTALWAVFGASLGLLLRNPTAASIVAFVWFSYVEWMLMTFLPNIARWLPTGASKAIVGMTRTGFPTPGGLLPVWGGALLFLGYALVAATAARAVSVNRDVT